MPQYSFIEKESFERGAKRTILVPQIAIGAFKQYTRDHTKLRDVIRKYGAFNQIAVMNNSVVDVSLVLDFNANKTYYVPTSSSIGIDEIMFQEFNIVNMDAAAVVAANTITVVASYESPLVRERFKTKKMFGGR